MKPAQDCEVRAVYGGNLFGAKLFAEPDNCKVNEVNVVVISKARGKLGNPSPVLRPR